MSNPQQPELRRSGQASPVNPDAIGDELEAEDRPRRDERTGHVPPGNEPGRDQGPDPDKPDPEAVGTEYGIDDEDPSGDRAAEAAHAEHRDDRPA